MKYCFTNIIGSFVLDENLKIIDQIPFKTIEEFQTKEQTESKLKQKYPDLQPLPEQKIKDILNLFKDKKYFQEFYQKNLLITKASMKTAVTEDQFIIQAIANINELDKVSNLLCKRLREWYSFYLPELSEHIGSNEKFTELVQQKTKIELLQDLKIAESVSMGADIGQIHIEEMKELAQRIKELYTLRKKHEDYLRGVMQVYCPNLVELAGVTIGAKLIELGKGLKRLALLPSSTVQLLGAEKALFRHIKTGSRSPKYGVLFQHPLIQNAHRDMKGKAARALADKLSLCIRLDYFKGELKAPEYKKDLEDKFKP